MESLGALSFHTLEEPFLWLNPWTNGEEEELKPFKFERNMRALRRSPRKAREDWNWFWLQDAIMPLLCWMANHLYQFGQVWPITPQWWQRCYFFCLGFWELAFLALGFLASFLSCLEGASKIDLPLSMFSLDKSILTSLFSISTLLLGGTKTVVLVEVILEEKKPYLKPVRLKEDF